MFCSGAAALAIKRRNWIKSRSPKTSSALLRRPWRHNVHSVLSTASKKVSQEPSIQSNRRWMSLRRSTLTRLSLTMSPCITSMIESTSKRFTYPSIRSRRLKIALTLRIAVQARSATTRQKSTNTRTISRTKSPWTQRNCKLKHMQKIWLLRPSQSFSKRKMRLRRSSSSKSQQEIWHHLCWPRGSRIVLQSTSSIASTTCFTIRMANAKPKISTRKLLFGDLR